MAARRGRGEGSIIQRANGTWYAQISGAIKADGTLGRKTVSGRTKAEVQKKLHKENAKLGETKPLAAATTATVEGFLASWLRDSVAISQSAATHASYARQIRLWINPTLGKIRLNDLGTDDIETVLADMLDQGKGGSARQMVRTVILSAMNRAVQRKLIAVNPAADVVIPKREETEFTVLTREQCVAFLEACKGERLCCLWETAIQTGMRIGELLALQKTDLDLPAGLVNIRRTQSIIEHGKIVLKSPKTKAGRRVVTIGKTLARQLNQHIGRMKKEGLGDSIWLFCDASGEMLSRNGDPYSSFYRILKAAGLPRIRIHDTRHTHATLLLADGENVKVVSERLGHASTAITLETYGHVLPTMQRGAADRIDRLLG